jgi:riboflavin biosynthesis pyrimidine reductase
MQQMISTGADADDVEVASWYAFPDDVVLRVNMIMTADGLAVAPDGLSKGLSGPEDSRLLGILRAVSDAVVVGAGTLRTEHYHAIRTRPSLRDYRREAGLAEHPVTVMVTRRPAVDGSYRCLAEAPVRPIVVCAEDSGALADVADVIECPDSVGGVDLMRAVAALARRGLTRLHSEGGPQLLARFLGAGVLDEYCLTISPRILGGTIGIRPVMGPTVPTGFTLQHMAVGDDFLFLRYRKSPR